MEIWAIILIIVLFIILGLIIGLTWWTERENTIRQQRNILFPFSGRIDPGNTHKPVQLTTAEGKNQIQCPVGYNVNIVGAWVEVNDPFGECSFPTDTFKTTCGDDTNRASAVDCSNDGDCAEGTHCISNKCVPMGCGKHSDCGANSCPKELNQKCTSDSDCGHPLSCVGGKNKTCKIDPTKGTCNFCLNGKCAQGPTCSNLDKNTFKNKMCENKNRTSKCRPRDASAYLAAECDGKNSCSVEWDWKSSKFFGPLPCRISPGEDNYSKLPIIPGWGGGQAARTDTTVNANYNQGYYVHGIFTCIKADED